MRAAAPRSIPRHDTSPAMPHMFPEISLYDLTDPHPAVYRKPLPIIEWVRTRSPAKRRAIARRRYPSSDRGKPSEDLVSLENDPLDDLSRRQHIANQHR